MKKLQLNLEDITYRMWKDEKDYQIFADLINDYYRAFDIDRVDNANDNKKWLEAQKDFDPKKMLFVAEYEGKPFSMQCYYSQKELNGQIIFNHWFGINPEWVESKIFGDLFDQVESEIIKAAKILPAGSFVNIRNYYEDKEQWLAPFLKERDYHEVRYFFDMSRLTVGSIPERKLAPGLEIKPADTLEKIIQVMKATDKAFEGHFGHTTMTDETMKAWMEQEYFNPSLWKIAWEGENVVGCVLNYIDKKENEILNRKRGYTEVISCQRSHRQQGVASALIAESIKMFREMEMDEVALGVDSTNSSEALGLYESFGYVTYKRVVALDRKIR